MNADDIFKAGRALGAMAESLRAAASLATLAAGAKDAADATEATGGDATFARAAERTFADLAVAHAGAALEQVAGAASAVSPTAGALVEAARLAALDGYRRARDSDLDANGTREDVTAAGAAERAGGVVVNVAAGDAQEERLHAPDRSTQPRCACGEPASLVETESTTGGVTWHVKRYLCAACSARDHKPPVHGYHIRRSRVEA